MIAIPNLLALKQCAKCCVRMDLKKMILDVTFVNVRNAAAECVECIVNMALNLTKMVVR